MSILTIIKRAVEALFLLIKAPPKKSLYTKDLAINAFFNKREVGTLSEQSDELKYLGLTTCRILLYWSDDMQPEENSPIFWGFIDDVIEAVPENALIVVAGIPNWTKEFGEWGATKKYIAFFEKVCERYGKNPKVLGFQVANEPDNEVDDNIFLGYSDAPIKYYNVLSECSERARSLIGEKIITNAATTSIIQNFPNPIKYNEALLKLGAENIVDVWSIHFYGSSYWRVPVPFKGAQDFIDSIKKPIWVTELGIEGLHKQIEYFEKTVPYLQKKFPKIEKFFIYQWASPEGSYGLKQYSSEEPPKITESDLYFYLNHIL